MPSSLVPEKPLLVYPSLASTLGLEESIFLCALAERVEDMQPELSRDFAWYQLETKVLLRQFPFWNGRDLERISYNLREKGVMIISTTSIDSSEHFRFAFNEKVQQQMASAQPSVTTAPSPQVESNYFLGKNFISPTWQPDDNTLSQLVQHAIPRQFAMQQVPEFITYWRDRNERHHSWGAKFHKHVLRKWRDYETQRHRKEQETQMGSGWVPSADAMEILVEKAGIKREFIEDAIPEFVLYWQERGESHRTWNTKFVQHVRVQWAKFTTAIEHNTDPRQIPANWQPSRDVYDVLRLANIDLAFAQALIPEFVLYWRDRGTLHGSWNTKYLQHVKHHWANRHSASPTATRQTRDMSLEEQLTDRSWAN
jgi:hypothetical protein